MSFDNAFLQTLGHEGGYVNDPQDPGGETKWGISKRAFPELDIKNLTIDDAKEIYRRKYWDRLQCDDMISDAIAAEIFDTAVNVGVKGAIRIAQQALAYLGEGIVGDGIIGPKTLEALNWWSEKDERALFKCLNGFQFMHYVKITSLNKTLSRFSHGWMRRIQDYREVNKG